jgi:hypothetical protein
MASTLYSSDCAVGSGIQPRAGIGLCTVSATYALAAALELDDLIHMVKIPAGATLLDVILDVPDLDTDVSPAITLSVGYTGELEAFISQDTVGQAGGIVRLSVPGGSQTLFAAEDTLQISATAAPATGAATGTLKLTAIYTMDP